MELKEMVDTVGSREEFAKFVAELRQNLIAHPEQWENRRLEDFLYAVESWVEDMDGYYLNHNLPVPVTPTWKTLAEVLFRQNTTNDAARRRVQRRGQL